MKEQVITRQVITVQHARHISWYYTKQSSFQGNYPKWVRTVYSLQRKLYSVHCTVYTNVQCIDTLQLLRDFSSFDIMLLHLKLQTCFVLPGLISTITAVGTYSVQSALYSVVIILVEKSAGTIIVQC